MVDRNSVHYIPGINTVKANPGIAPKKSVGPFFHHRNTMGGSESEKAFWAVRSWGPSASL